MHATDQAWGGLVCEHPPTFSIHEGSILRIAWNASSRVVPNLHETYPQPTIPKPTIIYIYFSMFEAHSHKNLYSLYTSFRYVFYQLSLWYIFRFYQSSRILYTMSKERPPYHVKSRRGVAFFNRVTFFCILTYVTCNRRKYARHENTNPLLYS